jgi:hypothetical protein
LCVNEISETISNMSSPRFSTGLSSADEFDPAEADRLKAWYRDEHGNGDPDIARFAPFLIDHRPAALKRYRRHAEAIAALDGLPQAAVPLLYGYWYLLAGYEHGVVYEVIAARRWGATKAEVLDVLELAFLDGGPHTADTAAAAGAVLRDWPALEPRAVPNVWPDDWPARSDAAAQAAPRYTALLGREAPGVAETFAARFTAVSETFELPPALVPLMRMTAAIIRGRAEAAADAAAHARDIGVPRRSAVATLAWASFGSSTDALEAAAAAIEPVLDTWP